MNSVESETADYRKIIHADCDCFYASIEMRDNPELRGKPLAVGGSAERRGVVATCNYEAREFGIHSAMASATARRLCPQLIIIRPAMEKYRQASAQIHDIFNRYTQQIEPLSLDEAYLDVTHCEQEGGDAEAIARAIRRRVADEVGINISAGIAPNKFIAKIASDWNKPNGQFAVAPTEVDEFVAALPVKKLHGVGKVTARRMQSLGITTCADLRRLDALELEKHFGSFGRRLGQLCRGIDDRPVQPDRIRKSVSVENTYPQDLKDLESCLAELPALLEQLEKRMERVQQRYRITKQVVKIKFHDFVQTTVESLSAELNMAQFQQLCRDGFSRGNRPVRLLGLGVRVAPLAENALTEEQLSFELESRD